MSTIVTRANKGSALTFTEGDANIVNLNNDKLENINNESIGDLSDVVISAPGADQVLKYDTMTNKWINATPSTPSIALDNISDVTITGASNGQTLIYNSTTFQWENQTPSSGGIASVSADANPQLGGNLDVNGKEIFTINNGDIVLAPAGTGKTITNRLNYNEAVHSLGTTSGTVAPNAANGNVQTITLNGDLTLNAFTTPVEGQSITLIVNTGGTGRTLTSSMKWAGGEKTLSTTDTTDIISIFYDGTNYWASLSKDFQ
jgi:hypothetical protein